MLTEGPERDDTNTSRGAVPSKMDPRLVAMVRFLARRAAERDFYDEIIKLREAEHLERGQEEGP